MTYLEAIIIAIVEGVTEFLPVSSTGHMIIASALMGVEPTDFVKLFTVAIQFGAILSVLVLYWRRFLTGYSIYLNLFIAFLPAVFFGLLLSDIIDELLGNPLVVGIALLVGGVVLLFIDAWADRRAQAQQQPVLLDNLNWVQSLRIGLFQVLSMVPGVSRSAATIIGGLFQGLDRKQAAEFSFLLAMPTMLAATVKSLYDYYKDGHAFTKDQFNLLAVGNVVAFIVAFIAVRAFVGLITRYGFRPFGYYRILVGAFIITLYLLRADRLNMF